MNKPFLQRYNKVILLLVLIAVDLCVFLLFGILLMGYDDHYDSTKGEYWSLASMNRNEKIIYISYQVWIVLNFVGGGYLLWRVLRKGKNV